jgi:hypothetical protein
LSRSASQDWRCQGGDCHFAQLNTVCVTSWPEHTHSAASCLPDSTGAEIGLHLRAQFSSVFFQKVSGKEKCKICIFFLILHREETSEIEMVLKLEKQNELTEMQLAADTDSDSYEKES